MLSKIVKTSFVKYSLALLSLTVLSILTIAGGLAYAQPYGSGSYRECKYGQSCPATSVPRSGGGGGITTSTDDNEIVLNNFNEYFTSDGKQLELTKDQKVFFELTKDGQTTRYVATVKEIGNNFAVITIGNNPTEVRLAVGDVQGFDVDGDGINDIEVTLVSISGGKAIFKFRALVLDASTTNTPKEPSASTAEEESKGFNWLLIGSIALLSAGLIWWFILLAKKRKKDKN